MPRYKLEVKNSTEPAKDWYVPWKASNAYGDWSDFYADDEEQAIESFEAVLSLNKIGGRLVQIKLTKLVKKVSYYKVHPNPANLIAQRWEPVDEV